MFAGMFLTEVNEVTTVDLSSKLAWFTCVSDAAVVRLGLLWIVNMLSSQTELKVRLWQGILIIPKISIIHELHHNRGRPLYTVFLLWRFCLSRHEPLVFKFWGTYCGRVCYRFSCRADGVWRWLKLCVGHGWGKSGLWSSLKFVNQASSRSRSSLV